jgi:predicted DNA-binding transcriptional regulator AlpA
MPSPPAKPAARTALAGTGLAPRGLERALAASYIGVSASLFDVMVSDGRMPQARKVGTRLIWDVRELDAAFDDLPRAHAQPTMPSPTFQV